MRAERRTQAGQMKIVSSGIPGFDEILNGGFNHPSTILVAGTAGAGKTTFALQSLFNAAKENNCLFISSISEPAGMMQSYMTTFSFYDTSLIERKKLRFFNIDEGILARGANDIIGFVEEKIRQTRPDRIVIDPATVMVSAVRGEHEQRLFIFNLLTRLKSWNVLALLTGEFVLEDLRKSPLGYLVDGIIYLSEEQVHDRSERCLQVFKMRGICYNPGRHTYSITNSGITVYPRLMPAPEYERPVPDNKVSSGISGLDRMLMGGFYREDAVLVSGSPGSGKTTFGLQFINEGARNGEQCLIVTFEERPAKLLRSAGTLGLDLRSFVEKGLLRILSFSPELYNPDEHALKIRKVLRENNIKRALFDGLENLETSIPDIPRRRNYVHSLVDMFGSSGATSLLTDEIPELFGTIRVTQEAISGSVDAIILLRHVEAGGRMRKALSILKSRGSDHDKEIREFEITGRGIEVRQAIIGYENVLSGSATKSPAEVFREKFGEGQ